MASFPPPIRQSIELPTAPVEMSIKMIAPGFPVYFCWILLMGILLLIPTAIDSLVYVARHPGQNPLLRPNQSPIETVVMGLGSLIVSFPVGIIMVIIQKIALEQVKGFTPVFRMPTLNGRGIRAGYWYLLVSACMSLVTIPLTIAARGMDFASRPEISLIILPAEIIFFLVLDVYLLATLLVPLLIVEKGLGFREALLENIALVKPKFWGMFFALVLCQLFAILGVFACCVGIIYTCIAMYIFPSVIYYYFVPETYSDRSGFSVAE